MMRTRLGLLPSIVVVACGAPAVPTSTPPLPGDGSGASTSASGPTLPEALLVHLRGVPLRAVALQPSEAMPAFDAAAAQRVFDGWLLQNGLTLADRAEVERRYQRAAAGQDVRTGAACGAPLPDYAARDRWDVALGHGGTALADVLCEPDCILQVTLQLGVSGDGGTEFYAAPFDLAQPVEAELARRLPQLRDNGGHERLGHGNNPVAVVGVPRPAGLYPPGRLDDAVGEAASACAEPAGASVPVTITTDGAAITACAPTAAAPADAVSACVCAALDGQAFVARPGPHELRFGSPTPREPAPAYVVSVLPGRGGDGEWLATSEALRHYIAPSAAQLRACWAPGVVPPDATARFTINVDAVGAVTSTSMRALAGVIADDAQACLKAAFATTQVPCPGVERASLALDLELRRAP